MPKTNGPVNYNKTISPLVRTGCKSPCSVVACPADEKKQPPRGWLSENICVRIYFSSKELCPISKSSV